MSIRMSVRIAALLMASAVSAGAQQAPGGTGGTVDVGVRFTDINGDAARFQRFRDEGNGTFLDRVRFNREGTNWEFGAAIDHAGRRDQRYLAEYRGNGKLEVSFEWDQVPLFYSQDTRTLYTAEQPGVLRVANGIQSGIQTGAFALADVIGGASRLDTLSRRDTATFDLVYRASRDLDVKVNLRSVKREGTQPYFASFGFSNAVEVPLPVDSRTTDINANVEWSNTRGLLNVGYNASWFDNHAETLIWDNPLKLTDSTYATAYSDGRGTSQGRMALWPSNTVRGVTTAGALALPGDSRVTANLAVNSWQQNQPLLPFTINTAIAPLPLERSTAEAEVRTLAMNYAFTSRPNRYTWVNAKYRYYDLANRSPIFHTTQYVRMDQVWEPWEEGHNALLEYTRHNLDLDASFTPVPFTAIKVGYGRDSTDRTHRIFAQTNENVVRATIDSVGLGWVTVRGIVEKATRRGSGFDEAALVEIGEQPTLQHFDIAERDRNRVTGLFQLTPGPVFGLTASVSSGKDDYKNSGFGLRNNKNSGYGVTLDLVPQERVAATLSYSFDKYTALQNSRTASPGPQFVDPTRNWSVDSSDKTHTLTANLDLLKLVTDTDIRVGFNLSRSSYLYVFGQPPNSTLNRLVSLPPVKNELASGTFSVTRFITPKLGIGVMYWYDRYRVNDFALGPETLNRLDLPGSMYLGYVYRPYTAHSAWLRLQYLF